MKTIFTLAMMICILASISTNVYDMTSKGYDRDKMSIVCWSISTGIWFLIATSKD